LEVVRKFSKDLIAYFKKAGSEMIKALRREGLKKQLSRKELSAILSALAIKRIIKKDFEPLILLGIEVGAERAKIKPRATKWFLKEWEKDSAILSKHIANEVRSTLHRSLLEGIKLGESPYKLSLRIRETLRKPLTIEVPPTTFIRAGKKVTRAAFRRVVSIERWAEMIARTEGARLFIEAEMDQYKRANVRKFEWICGFSPCELCAPRCGKVYHKGNLPSIPAHPYCVCDLAPVI